MANITSALEKKKLKNQSGRRKKQLISPGAESRPKLPNENSGLAAHSNSLKPQKIKSKKSKKIFQIDAVKSPLRASIWHKSNIINWMEKLSNKFSNEGKIIEANLAHEIKKSLLSCCSKSIFEVTDGKAKLNVELKADKKENFYWSAMARCKKVSDPYCANFRSKMMLLLSMAWCFKHRKKIEQNHNSFLTFTSHHTKNTSVSSLYKRLDEQMTKLQRWFAVYGEKNNKFGNTKLTFRGYTMSMEATAGPNGVHLHWHVFYTCESEQEMLELQRWYFKLIKRLDLELKKEFRSYKTMPMSKQKNGFKILSNKDNSVKNIMNYIAKGITETVSPHTKTKQRKENKLVFMIENMNEAKMYFDFYYAVAGKRLFRSAGVCKEITGSQTKEDDIQSLIDKGEIDLNESMQTLYTIEVEKVWGKILARKTNDVSLELIEKYITDLEEMKTYVTKFFDNEIENLPPESWYHQVKEKVWCDTEKTIIEVESWKIKENVKQMIIKNRFLMKNKSYKHHIRDLLEKKSDIEVDEGTF